MSAAAYVDQATEWASAIVRRESRGPGDTEAAMRRIEARYGLPFSLLWSLRYRKPKGIETSLFVRLQSVYLAEVERQQRLLNHERAATEAKTWLGRIMVGAVDRLGGESAAAVGASKPGDA